ncbi:hypothetical protein NECAME_00666 [Necator americanus]|uniref:Uncharacterized protein n=1 Tax=Necator americanus TaxID=51031 RepID=W2SZU5_NECAM|nr:hypothetical protein NECAME_00666 [Necator americanus]ETN75255.1 hypothetical protein NECAME_00666 [Necator americanus]
MGNTLAVHNRTLLNLLLTQHAVLQTGFGPNGKNGALVQELGASNAGQRQELAHVPQTLMVVRVPEMILRLRAVW